MVRRMVGRWWWIAAVAVVVSACASPIGGPEAEPTTTRRARRTTTTEAEEPATTRPRPSTTRRPPTESMHLVYAVPADVTPKAGRAAAIRHEAKVVSDFFAGQLAGRRPRYEIDLTTGDPLVAEVVLPWTAAQIETTAAIADEIHVWLQSRRLVGDHVVPAIYLEGKATLEEHACGWAQRAWRSGKAPTEPEDPVFLLIPLANCDVQPSTRSSWSYGGTALLAHEITHLLGAVPEGAPHHADNGHTNDDPRDLMSTGERDWDALQLDPGNDDYLGHGRDDLVDITNSPLLLPA